MAYRIIDVKVVQIEAEYNRLVIQRKKVRSGTRKSYKTLFKVDSCAVVSRGNASIGLSDVQVGDRVIVDFIKINEELIAKGITVLTKKM